MSMVSRIGTKDVDEGTAVDSWRASSILTVTVVKAGDIIALRRFKCSKTGMRQNVVLRNGVVRKPARVDQPRSERGFHGQI